MKSEELIILDKVIARGLLTFFKGVKIDKKGINFEKEFNPIFIDLNNLNEYRDLFCFQNEFPISYWYLLAQRAQVACMLDKRFTISIPGLIHVENILNSHSEVNLSSSIKIKCNVVVDYKKKGSLIPVFEVQFYQNEILIAECKSIYIAKRKTKIKNNKIKQKNTLIKVNNEVLLEKMDALNYAQISGDRNPIHTSSLFALLFGYKSTIIQGWYLASLAFSLLENKEKEYNSFTCGFIKPVYLPQKIQYSLKDVSLFFVNNNKLIMKSELLLI